MTATHKDTARLALGAAAVFALARGALHLATFHLPISTDDAVPMIQTYLLRHGQPVTTLINQPYNGTLDTYLIAPLTLLFSAHAAFRIYELLCAIGLVVLVSMIARRLADPQAARVATLLAAMGTPYMVMLTAIGPVPNFLIPLVVALMILCLWPHEGGSGGVSAARAFGAGLVTGLSTWNTVLTVPGAGGALVGLAVAGVPLRAAGLPFAAGFAIGYSPAVLSRLVGASGPSPSASVQPYGVRTFAHWTEGLAIFVHAAKGLFGVDVALVVDGPEREYLPFPVRVLLAVSLLVLAAAGLQRRMAPLVGWAIALSAAFALSGRTEPHDVRYMYGLVVPMLVLVGAGSVRLWRWSAPVAAALLLVVTLAWAQGDVIVLRHWRDPQHAARVWQVPDLGPTLDRLTRLGARSAYASLQFACRLVVESDERILASQAWNERLPGDPLRFRDEVDLDPHAAWVLSTWLSRGMPRAGGFRAELSEMGGSWHEESDGDVVVFHDFAPPFAESRPVPAREMTVLDAAGPELPAAVLDRDVTTRWQASLGLGKGSGLVVRVAPPRRLSAVVLAVDLAHSPLGVPWVATVDGAVVAHGPHRFALQWIGGVPRAGKEALLTVVLPEGPPASEVRVLFQGAGPALAVSEVFAYGPDEPVREAGGEASAAAAYEKARAGQWADAVRLYEEAARREPDRASYQAALLRARFRAAGRQVLDVESLDDGGAAVLGLTR